MFCMKTNIKVFYTLTVSFLLVIARYAQNTTQIASLQYLCNTSTKKGGMKLIFCMQISSNIRTG